MAFIIEIDFPFSTKFWPIKFPATAAKSAAELASPFCSRKTVLPIIKPAKATPKKNNTRLEIGEIHRRYATKYVTKEKAIEKWNTENDTTWKKFLKNNPLPESIDFYVKANYVDEDSLNILSNNLQSAFPGVISEFQFPTETVAKVSTYVKTGGIIFLIAAILLTILVVFSIDNTIRLAMYSNRFLIKTMQMVGATRGFIAKPINQRAVINGLIASGIAIFAIWGSVMLIEGILPDFKLLHDNAGLIMLFFVIIILGITISLASTHRAVIKYLKMKLDDLY